MPDTDELLDGGPVPDGSAIASALNPAGVRRLLLARRAGIGIGTLVLLAGAFFAFRSATGRAGNSPDDAVQAFYGAIGNEDAIGLAETLAPAERDVLLNAVVPVVEQLKRLDVFDRRLDLRRVEGVAARIADVQTEARRLRADLAAVRVTGGTATLSFDLDKLPLGKFLRDAIDDDGAARQSGGASRVSSFELGGENFPIVVVKQGRRWYVSLGYSIGYAATGKVPTKGLGVRAVGASDPAGAVRDFLDAAATLDVRRVIELLPPDEMAALHDFSSVFIDDAEQSVTDVRQQYTVSFPKLEFAVTGSGELRRVKVTRFAMRGRLENSDGGESTVAVDGRCLKITTPDRSERRCGREVLRLIGTFGGPEVGSAGLDKSADSAKRKPNPDLAFTVVQRSGRWFVSPTQTLANGLTRSLALLDAGELAGLRDDIAGALDSGAS